MPNSHFLKPGVVEDLSKFLTKEQMLADPESCKTYGNDWTSVSGRAGLVLRPRTTAEVSAILKVCHSFGQTVVPSAGRTGLAGGAVSNQHQIVISCEQMTTSEPVDSVARTVVVQPGVITEDLQRIAEEAGLYFAIDLGAKGSSRIGGNIASNTGGLKLIRYGGMREQVLGLEVVLPNGEVLDLNRQLYKDNTGYKLQHLFIGSEGTLGYVTKACIRLWSPPPPLRVACIQLTDLSMAPKISQILNQSSLELYAVEYFDSACLRLVQKVNPDVRAPAGIETTTELLHYLLIEVDDHSDQFETIMMDAYDKGLVKDVIIGQSATDQRELWRLRELISESISVERQVYKNDISLPIGSLVDFLNALTSLLTQRKTQLESDGIEILCFGHIGDGNIHLNYTGTKKIDAAHFKQLVKNLEASVFKLVNAYKGSISAEHGIGTLKKAHMSITCSPAEIAWMKSVKKLFDPDNIMNPGKILDME